MVVHQETTQRVPNFTFPSDLSDKVGCVVLGGRC